MLAKCGRYLNWNRAALRKKCTKRGAKLTDVKYAGKILEKVIDQRWPSFVITPQGKFIPLIEYNLPDWLDPAIHQETRTKS